ncbi:MAG TPA: hypothetical protein ENH10_00625, partial [Bacteroidetes bacterium]|nr:hypothetical protein [Bacteroidota bacterium]HEX03649.1 hypothetical protein [Bacteroidota bacterium]
MLFRNWVGVFAAILVIAAGLTGCQKKSDGDAVLTAADYSRLTIPSHDYFQMQDSTQVFGKMSQLAELTVEEGRDLLKVEFDIQVGVQGKSVLFIDYDTGDPVRMESTQMFQGVEMSSNVYYQGDSVMRVMSTPADDGLDTLYTDIPEGTRDWTQAGFLLRALDLESLMGDTVEVSFYQGFGQAFVKTADVVIVGKEQVVVPAGEFETVHVHIDYANT